MPGRWIVWLVLGALGLAGAGLAAWLIQVSILWLFVAVGLMLVTGIWLIPRVQLHNVPGPPLVGKEAADVENSFRTTLAQIIGGIAVIGGLTFTYRQLQDAELVARQTQASAQEQIKLTRQSQIADRFTRAVDQLGSERADGTPKLDVRMGGVYALAAIAKDSDSESDRATVLNILTTYVRQNVPSTNTSPRTSSDGGAPSPTALCAPEQTPRADIAAILRLLGGDTWKPDKLPDSPQWTLANTNLHGLRLTDADLSNLSLVGSDLTDANLNNVHLNGAVLNGASLNRTCLQSAHLAGAHLENAELIDAQLQNAHFGDARLWRADLTRANLSGADLTGVQGMTDRQWNSSIHDSATRPPDVLLSDAGQ